MIALLASVALAGLSLDQQIDFDCLRLGSTMSALRMARPQQLRWERASLRRLKEVAPHRDWTTEAKPLGDITYRDFISRLAACQRHAHADQREVR